MNLIAQPRKGVIYTIKDPNTNLVVYVGKSFDFTKRKSEHINSYKRYNNKKSNWIKFLLDNGQRPLFEIIDDCDEIDWELKERQYIKLYKSFGANLFNVTNGGEIGSMGHKRTEEEKEYYRKLYTGRKNSLEQRNLNSKSLKHKWDNDENYRKSQTKISIENLKKITPEHIQKRISKIRISLGKKSKVNFCLYWKVYHLFKQGYDYKTCSEIFEINKYTLESAIRRKYGGLKTKNYKSAKIKQLKLVL